MNGGEALRDRADSVVVAADVRRRLLRAVGKVVAERGYDDCSIDDIAVRAELPRETFFEHFDSKEACFLDAYDASIDWMLGVVAESVDAADDPLDCMARVLDQYLAVTAKSPYARVFSVDLWATREAGMRRQAEGIERFAAATAWVLGASTEHERFACKAWTSAATLLVTQMIASGRTHELRQLKEPMMEMLRRCLHDPAGAVGGV